MIVSGFTFVRNAGKLFIPAREAIMSVLPLVDEFVVALGDGDEDDETEELINSINTNKIRIIRTKWDTENFPRNTIFAQQTDVAKEACKGDWLFYIQCDEALHEQYHSRVRTAMERYVNDKEVEGLLFRYKHFWGDFEHYNPSHVFYPREIRIIRNLPQIHSWKDAQSFRYFEGEFNYTYDDYQEKENSRKLNVAAVDAEIYHYGWVRPPELMSRKRKLSSSTYRGTAETEKLFANAEEDFDYGPLKKVSRFEGTHPEVMKDWLQKIYWKDRLNYGSKRRRKKNPLKHERLKYRMLTWIETRILGGRRIGEFKNFNRIR